MGERSEAYYRHVYDHRQVVSLLGLREGRGGWGRTGDSGEAGGRHVTLPDLLSWAQDPGGDRTAYLAALLREPKTYWMARRGPLSPDSEDAAVLWDLLRAMSTLSLRQEAILVLKAYGLNYREIGEALGVSKDEVSRTIWGTPRHEGAVPRVIQAMNSGSPGRPRSGDEAQDAIAVLRRHIAEELQDLRELLESQDPT